MSVNVKSVANPQETFALCDGDKAFGFFGLYNSFMFSAPEGYEGPSIYMMSDFAISPTIEKHLSKLVLCCVLSKEVQMVAERMTGKKIRTINTNAFSKNQVSMKYRGLFEKALCKVVEKDENGNPTLYNLTYVAQSGQWTLKEGYELWKQKYSK